MCRTWPGLRIPLRADSMPTSLLWTHVHNGVYLSVSCAVQGPDCGFHCVPNPPKYNFMAIAGGAICECERCYTGTYCDIRTCPDEANSSTTQSTDKGTTQVLPGAGASSAATGARGRLSLTVQTGSLWLAAVLVAMALADSIGSWD